MPILANDVILISIVGRCFGQRIILTHTVRSAAAFAGTGTTAGQLESIAQGIADADTTQMVNTYLACLPPQYQALSLRTQVIGPLRSVYAQVALTDRIGTHPSPATVANDAAAITLRTFESGRKEVSTKHIGPVPDAISSAGLIIGAYRTVLGNLGNQLITSFPGNDGLPLLIPTIYHREANTNSPVRSFIVGEQSRTQRRRTVGLGE